MSWLRNNGLSLVAGGLFVAALAGQSVAGHRVHNEEEAAHGQPPVTYVEYVRSSDFAEAVFENWESEFMQMGLFVFLTALLVQKGSAESLKPPDEEGAGEEPVREDPRLHRDDPGAPWPVRRGGWILKLYENSLSLAFLLFFVLSFTLHGVSGARAYNEEQAEHGEARVSVAEYMTGARFWEESLQNWQSEYLAVLAIVVFSIYLRQRGSPESKPVHKPHDETGNE